MQLPEHRPAEVLEQKCDSYHLLIGWVIIAPSDDSAGIRHIGLSGTHCVHKAYDYPLIHGRITGFVIRSLVVKFHRHLGGN
jgi:hypothetical protein